MTGKGNRKDFWIAGQILFLDLRAAHRSTFNFLNCIKLNT